MDLGLKDRVAIVGGGSKGLGLACALSLAQEGAKVAICSRTVEDLEAAAQEIRSATSADVLTVPGICLDSKTSKTYSTKPSSILAGWTSWSVTPGAHQQAAPWTPPKRYGSIPSKWRSASLSEWAERRSRI